MAVAGGHRGQGAWWSPEQGQVGLPHSPPPSVPTGQSCPWRVRLRSPALGTASPGPLSPGLPGCPQGCHVLGGPAPSLGVTTGQARLEARAPCLTLGRSSQGPSGLFGPVTRPCPRAEGGASLLGGSAWAPTPGRASVQPELWPARSHTGTAAKETWSRAAPHIPAHMCSPAHTEITPLQATVNIYHIGAHFSWAPGSEAFG